MTALAAAQDAMQDWLLHGDPGIAAFVDAEDAPQRLRIYADAYRLRLLEVLGADFPATKATLGDAAFAAFAAGYLRDHPSTRPSVRHVGDAFADWLATRDDAPQGLHELARFEWLQGECFDAADVAALGIGDVAALPVEAWPALQLRLLPCVRLLPSQRLALRGDAPGLADGNDAADWLLWRADLDVHWRRLDADEADALRVLQAGASFGTLCERLARHHGHHGEAGPLRAASLLKRWLGDGLLAAS